MAVVRFSKELRYTIINNAKNIHRPAIVAANDAAPTDWADRIYDLMFQDTSILMEALPEGYMDTRNQFTISGFGNEGDERVSMEMSKRRRWPESIAKEGNSHGLAGGSGSSYSGYILDPNDPRWDEFKAVYNTFTTGVIEAETTQARFVNGVGAVIEKHQTLSPALKEWPALWDLIPEDKKDRHREIVERSRRSPTVSSTGEVIDLDSLTATVTAKKLMGGGE